MMYNKNMKSIREIVCSNLIMLRKQNKLTQQDLASKISYSDKAISRWEKGEVLPDIEVLQQLSNIYNVPLSYMLEEHSKEDNVAFILRTTKRIATVMLSYITVWTAFIVLYVYLKIWHDFNYWQLFVWALPISVLVLLVMNNIWGNKKYNIYLESFILWSLITAIFLQFLAEDVWLIYLVGVPIQLILIIQAIYYPFNKKRK